MGALVATLDDVVDSGRRMAREDWIGSGRMDWIGQGGLRELDLFWQNRVVLAEWIGSGQNGLARTRWIGLAEWIGSNQILLPDQSRGHCFLIGRGHCCFDWPQATHTKLLDFARHFVDPIVFVVSQMELT